MLANFHQNIPAEMRQLNQWVAAGPDKVPINPRTGKKADPTNPQTGGTFAEAVQTGMSNIGFILDDSDPYCVIDLDNPFERSLAGVKSEIKQGDIDYGKALENRDRHSKIYQGFSTYAEKSQSGKGVHLVMRGKIPQGVRRDKFEVYSNDRYIIFTGNVMRQTGIVDCQDLLDELFRQIGRLVDDTGDLIEEEPIYEDSKIWTMATKADNSEKFVRLCKGEWQEMGIYPSQSEADYALLSILCFYSRSVSQIKRMFRETALANRPKATKNDTYLNRGIKRIFNRMPALVDISKLMPVKVPPLPLKVPTLPFSDLPTIPPIPNGATKFVSFPPGLVGEVAEYILSTATRPVREVALGAAIAFCAGICARSFNISSNGLNQYVMILAPTGRGKDGAASGIDLLMSAISNDMPMASMFVGPGSFASGPALVKSLDKQPCFFSVLGEFGKTLKIICDAKASEANVSLMKVMLDVYSKSGFHKKLYPSVYSSTEKNTLPIQSPNVTLLGESNPSTFFASIDESHIAEGLIPRFIVLEYDGIRVPKNRNAFHPPSEELIAKLKNLFQVAITSSHNLTCIPVSMTGEAEKLIDSFGVEADSEINDGGGDVSVELWNRAELKVLKLAALIAATSNPHSPLVSVDHAQWSINMVRAEIANMSRHFKRGEVSGGEARQDAEIKRLFDNFQKLTKEQKSYYRCPDLLLDGSIMPFHFVNIYSRRLPCFKEDRRGAGRALQETLSMMVKSEVLEMIPLDQLKSDFGTRSPIYFKGPAWS